MMNMVNTFSLPPTHTRFCTRVPARAIRVARYKVSSRIVHYLLPVHKNVYNVIIRSATCYTRRAGAQARGRGLITSFVSGTRSRLPVRV